MIPDKLQKSSYTSSDLHFSAIIQHNQNLTARYKFCYKQSKNIVYLRIYCWKIAVEW